MKKIAWVFLLLLVTVPLFAQDAPPGPVTIPVSGKVVTLIATVFAVGGTMYKLIDGLKNFIPGLKENPTVLRWINVAGTFVIYGTACVTTGHDLDLGSLVKCLIEAVGSSLVAAGFYEAKSKSDAARAAASLPEFKATV